MAFRPISIDGDIFVPADTLDASMLVGPLPNKYSQTIVLAGLTAQGVWYPNQYVGPHFFNSSNTTISYPYYDDSGFYRIKKAGTLATFSWQNAGPPASPIPADLYLAPGGNPALFSYTGVSLSMNGGSYTTDNLIDTLNVNVDDLLVWYNPSFSVGYTPSAMTITAQFTPT